MKRFLIALAALLLAAPAVGQVKQSGNVTPTHVSCWVAAGTVRDCGASTSPYPTTFGVLNGTGQDGICVLSDQPTSTGYQRVCLGTTTAGGALISTQNFGTATPQGISFNINGMPSGLPLVILPTTGGHAACFDNTTGTLVDCGAPPGTSASIDIFLVIGDSNAVGQGLSASSPAVQTGQVLTYCANGTVVDGNDPACSAVTAAQNANTGSMWPSLGNAYGRRIGFVLTGVSGSTQATACDLGVGNGNWQVTTPGSNYANSLTALNAALTAYTTAGYSPTFKGIIYVLGGNDAAQIDASACAASDYTTAITAMVANYRGATIGGTTYPHLPIFLPIIGTSTSLSDVGYQQVRSAQQIFAATATNDVFVPFSDMFSFNSRGLMNSGAHPTQAGYNQMGAAIGSALIPAIPSLIPYQLFTANSAVGGAAPAGTVVQTVGANTSPANILLDAYAGNPVLQLRRADTTLLAPSAVQSGEVVGILGVQTYGATTFGTTNQGALLFSATQNHTDAAKGTQACIYTTANGAATPTCNLTVGQAGALTFAGYGAGVLQSSSGGAITSSTVPNASLANSSLTYGTTTVALGASSTSIAGLTELSLTSATGATVDWNGDAYLGRHAAANLRLGQTAAASPVAQILSVQNVIAGTSDTPGADWTIAGSQGTGTGIGGNIKFKVAPAGTTGTSVNALSDAMQVYNTKFVNIGGNFAPDANLTINANTGVTSPAAQVGTTLHLVGADATNNIFNADTFGNGTNLSLFLFRLAGGTRASLAATPAAAYVANIQAQGYDGVSAYGGLADIGLKTINQTSTTDHSGQIVMRTVATSATSLTQRLLVDQGVIIGSGTVDPGANNLIIGGTLTVSGITTDSTHTDATVCEDTTTHQFYFGSGAAGICLGTSSMRFKHDIAPLAAGLDQIEKLDAISYKLNADHGDPDKTLYGFTAEQGATVLPDLVGRDAEGRPQTFDYMGVVPVLVRAVQQLKADNDNLRQEIEALKRTAR